LPCRLTNLDAFGTTRHVWEPQLREKVPRKIIRGGDGFRLASPE
jgi:hypothetical protein